MTTKATIQNPEQVEITLAITLTLKEWRKLEEQLRDAPARMSMPAYGLIREIYTVAQSVDKAIPLLKAEGEGE